LASNPLHRIEFGPPKFFSKTCTFSIIFYSTLQFSGGVHFQKACRSESRKDESKQSEITCKQSEPARSISKIQKKREFVRVLCYEQCPKNSFKRLYIVEGLLVLVEKASFSKEFRCEFQCGGEGYPQKQVLFFKIPTENRDCWSINTKEGFFGKLQTEEWKSLRATHIRNKAF
jgi:hypothetical protein